MMWFSCVLCICWFAINLNACMDYMAGALSGIGFSSKFLTPRRPQHKWQIENRIFGGEATELDEFPWLALFQYLDFDGILRNGCSGSLINHRYVLTAAHCVKTRLPLVNIRLGEYNTLNPTRDCVKINGEEICNDSKINVGIEEVIPHQNYIHGETFQYDIALIRLDRYIQYSDYIQPISLVRPIYESKIGDMLTVAGWGRTEYAKNSNVKLKVRVPKVNLNVCVQIFGDDVNDNMICAGGEKGKDSCGGDSGGPLMRQHPYDERKWVLEGLVSFGRENCGLEGFPGVYTRVAKYIYWINANIKP